MSKIRTTKIRTTTIRTTLVALTAALALGSGTALVSAPLAQANPCTPSPTVACSMFWAEQVGSNAVAGQVNDQVTALQNALLQLELGITVTGSCDEQTTAVLLQYQKSLGLAQTGQATPETVAALRSGAAPSALSGQTVVGSVPRKSVSRKVAAPIPKASPVAAPAPVQTAAAKAVAFAYQQLGKPYVYGATGPSSYDCSGLTGSAWKSAGVSVPRTSYAQLGGLKVVSKSTLKPGDIVGFYSGGHVGLYVGQGYVIHASRPGRPVAKVPMSQMPYYKAVRPAG